MYCCEKFEEVVMDDDIDGFEIPTDEAYSDDVKGKLCLRGCCGTMFCHLLIDIKFCPFCGKDLSSYKPCK